MTNFANLARSGFAGMFTNKAIELRVALDLMWAPECVDGSGKLFPYLGTVMHSTIEGCPSPTGGIFLEQACI